MDDKLVGAFANIATSLGLILALVIFVWDRISNSRIRRKDLERTWYYNVLIQPNLEKIDTCFDYFTNTYKSIIEVLSRHNAHDDLKYLKLKAGETGKINAIRRKLELGIVEHIRRYDDSLYDILIDLLREIEDRLIASIEADKFTHEDVKEIENFLFNKKADLLELLYEPIRRPKPRAPKTRLTFAAQP